MPVKIPQTVVHHVADNEVAQYKASADKAQAAPLPQIAENATSKIKDAEFQQAHRKAGLIAAHGNRTCGVAKAQAVTSVANGLAETAYDGMFVGANGHAYTANTPLDQIPAIMPPPNSKGATIPRVVYVNGINTDKQTHYDNMKLIAKITHAPVVGIHNSTGDSPNMMARVYNDLKQCAWDKIDYGRNPAHDTLTRTIVGELRQGHSMHIMAHSQGGLITARSLNWAKSILLKDEVVERRAKLSEILKVVPHEEQQRMLNEIDAEAEKKVQQMLSKIKVETFGAASGAYTDGPQYVHYINDADNVPARFGVGNRGDTKNNWRAGKDAVVRQFNATYPSLNPFDHFVAPHAIDNCYMSYRVPFAQARKEGSTIMNSPVRPFPVAGYQINEAE